MADWAIFNSNAASEICSRFATSTKYLSCLISVYLTLLLTLIITVYSSIVLIFR